MRKDQITVYIPQEARDNDLVERLENIADEKDRSVNYLTIKAIEDFISKHEDELE